MFKSNLRAQRAIRSAIESLETRRLFAVVVSTADTDADGFAELLITGNGSNDRVLVYDLPTGTGSPATDVVVDNDNSGTYTAGDVLYPFTQSFEEIEANLNGGNDTFRYFLMSDLDAQTRSIQVDLGSGTNNFSASSPTSGVMPFDDSSVVVTGTDSVVADTDGADINNSDVSLAVLGGSSTDSIGIDFARTSINNQSRVVIDVSAGGGSDNVSFLTPAYNADVYPSYTALEAGITGESSVFVGVDLGTGTTNTALFEIQSNIVDAANLDIDVDGNSGVDNVSVNFNAATYSSGGSSSRSGFTFDANLLGGNDTFRGNLDFRSGTSFLGKNTQVRFNVLGGDQNDLIKWDDVTPSNGDSDQIDGLLDLSGRGGNGNDRVEVDLDNTTVSDPGIRLSVTDNGQFRSRLMGDAGDDKVFIDAVGSTSSTAGARYDMAVYGGSGNDRISVAFKNDGVNTPANYIGGQVLLDGGTGTDRWDTEGASPAQSPPFKRVSAEILDESLQSPQ